jgi:carotenoid cleavage dioxygenase-like enzyme
MKTPISLLIIVTATTIVLCHGNVDASSSLPSSNNNNNNNNEKKLIYPQTNLVINNNNIIKTMDDADNDTPEGRDTAFHYLFESCKSDQSNMTVQVDKLNGSDGIPSWVRATKFNNGFGKFEGEDFQFNYLFDVMAYIVKWQIVGNTVTFANKFIQSEYFQIAEKSTPTYRTFGGVKPPMTTKEKIQTLAHLVSDNLNVNVQRFGDRLLAISDMSGEMEVNSDTLDTRGILKWNDTITDKFTIITCAHPSQLAGEKYVYNYHVHLFSNFPHLGKLDTF